MAYVSSVAQEGGLKANAEGATALGKQIAEKAKAPQRESPPLSERVPKIIPNGIAPTINGKVSRTPLQNSVCGVEFMESHQSKAVDQERTDRHRFFQ